LPLHSEAARTRPELTGYGIGAIAVSLSLRLKDLLGPVTRVKKKKNTCPELLLMEAFPETLHQVPQRPVCLVLHPANHEIYYTK